MKIADFENLEKESGDRVDNNIVVTKLDVGDEGITTFTLTDQWQRFEVIGTPTIANREFVDIALNGNQGDTFYLWGAQLEQGSFATSYIPTSGASATRNQELCNNATPVINSEEGTLYAEISALADDGSFRFISVSDGTSSNRVRINYAGGSNQLGARIVSGGTTQSNFVSTISDVTDYVKLAISYKLNEVKFYINGSLISTDTSAIMPIGLSRLAFDDGSGSLPFFGNTKDLKYYPKALADVQLQDLTTL